MAVSIFENIFKGRKELFEDLFISTTDYDWKKYPVIRISFGSCSAKTGDSLNKWIIDYISMLASLKNNIIIPKTETASGAFSKYILELYRKEGPVVILVDEYEKVITDNIYNENIEELRKVLSDFYQVIKDMDQYIRFVFITGVTKYTKLSLFSKMNNLRDISLDESFAEMFGYTQEELEYYFSEHIDEKVETSGWTREELLSGVKKHYNGYRFHPKAKTVYNPVSVGTYFARKETDFDNYWIDTGGRLTMLYDIADKCSFDITKDMLAPILKEDFSTFDIMDINKSKVNDIFFKCFIYQCGYLTIKQKGRTSSSLILDFPNQEVRRAYTYGYLKRISENESMYARYRIGLEECFLDGHLDRAIEMMKGIFAGIPKFVYSNALKHNEYYYQSLVYMMFSAISITVRLEEIVSTGRIDAVAENDDEVFIIEFKLDRSAKEAIAQIRDNHYADAYLSSGKKIKLLGINLSSKERNISEYFVEDL